MDYLNSGTHINSISSLLAEMTLVNHYNLKAGTSQAETLFHTEKHKLKTCLEIIINNLLVIFRVEMSTVVTSVIYLDRLLNAKIRVNKDNLREYFIGCLILAVKMNEDTDIAQKVWGCSRLSLYDVSIIEFEILQFSDYNLYVSSETFEMYNQNLRKYAVGMAKSIQGERVHVPVSESVPVTMPLPLPQLVKEKRVPLGSLACFASLDSGVGAYEEYKAPPVHQARTSDRRRLDLNNFYVKRANDEREEGNNKANRKIMEQAIIDSVPFNHIDTPTRRHRKDNLYVQPTQGLYSLEQIYYYSLSNLSNEAPETETLKESIYSKAGNTSVCVSVRESTGAKEDSSIKELSDLDVSELNPVPLLDLNKEELFSMTESSDCSFSQLFMDNNEVSSSIIHREGSEEVSCVPVYSFEEISQ